MKLKYTIIEKLNNLTSTEMNLFVYICMCQEEATGRVEGLYYKDAMEFTGMCKQSFYNALKGLEDKHIISCEKNSEVDYDIRIPDNAFPWKGTTAETYKEGYVNLMRDVFQKKKGRFWKLKSHEKYLLFEFLKRTHENGHSYRVGVDRFYQEWTRALGVSVRVIRSYLHNLKKFFSIGIKGGNYFITYLHSVFRKQDTHSPDYKKQELYWHEQLVRKECNRLHIRYADADLQETAIYIGQHRKQVGGRTETMVSIVMRCIGKTVEGIRKCERVLDKKYVHKLVAERVNAIAEKLNEEKLNERSRSGKNGNPQKKNAFCNFNQRKYDYDELEKLLLTTKV